MLIMVVVADEVVMKMWRVFLVEQDMMGDTIILCMKMTKGGGKLREPQMLQETIILYAENGLDNRYRWNYK